MRHISKILAATLALAGTLVMSCNTTPPRSGPLPTPGFVQLQTLNPAATWSTETFFLSPVPAILPARGRAVRVSFTAAVGSTFTVSLREPSGIVTPIPQQQGVPPPSEQGYFQVVSMDTTVSPPVYLIYVRAPISLADPSNYAIEIVNQSLRTDVTDSAPLVVTLRQRPVYTVNVNVVGGGRVVSSPAGVQCGLANSGATLSPCSFEFPPGTTVTLMANSQNAAGSFVGWTGNCPANQQNCNLTLDGQSAMSATAHFGTSTIPAPTCPTAPRFAGLRWIDLPICDVMTLGTMLQCDAQGYFCCATGPMGSNAPRCVGTDQIESLAHCMHRAPTGMLRQPGGCYEVDSPL